jgi:D-alanyl-D-alanine-carboxypeptidase/D-alanyl-D-alanine-endopeptidase
MKNPLALPSRLRPILPTSPILLALLLLPPACGSSTPGPADAGGDGPLDGAILDGGAADEGRADTAADTAPDLATPDLVPDTATAGWAQIDALVAARATAAGVTRLGLTVWDASDRKVHEHMLGGFTAGTRVAIASASKLVSTLVVFDVIRRGLLTLESTTGQVLGWTGDRAAITLGHLLSFTSGLPREAACTLNATTTLAACVEVIAMAPAAAPPGTRFDYGSTHLHVAARMAEVATGRTWAQLFDETLRVPLALPEDVAYYTFPKQALGRMNPLIAGGMRASMQDYAGLLGLTFHKGSLGAVTVGTPALFDAQAREPFPGVTIGYTPFAAARYGLGSWVMCERPAMGCAVVSSPGAFGFTPWLDRDAGYYAILGMELSGVTADDRPAEFAVALMQELQPLIRAQLGR